MEVYKITNTVTNRVYIGSTKHTKEYRFACHQHQKSSGPLYLDILEYGSDNFELETLEVVEDPSQLRRREQYWICKYWDELGESKMINSQRGIASPVSFQGLTHTTESRRKMSESSKLVTTTSFTIDGKTIHGYRELLRYLQDTYKYDISYTKLQRAVSGYYSKSVKLNYPKVLEIVRIKKKGVILNDRTIQ